MHLLAATSAHTREHADDDCTRYNMIGIFTYIIFVHVILCYVMLCYIYIILYYINMNLQAFQLIGLARYLLGVPKP